MSYATDLISTLEPVAETLRQPRVKALHVPPPLADGTRRGEFAALELDDGSVGLTYVLLEGTLAALRQGSGPSAAAREWVGTPAMAVARRFAAGAAGVEATLGFAAAAALTHALWRRAGFVPPASTDSLATLDPGPGDHVGLVGLFWPLMDRFVASGARITVVELRPELAGAHPGFEVTLDRRALRACNKVLATGTLLLNQTLDEVLADTRGARRVAVVGPSAGVLPDPLFARGVHGVGGTWIEDPAAHLDALRSGLERRGTSRKFTLERDGYPGVQALLQRL